MATKQDLQAKNNLSNKKLLLGLTQEEYFLKGHRSCAGCGGALAMRYLTKAAGPNTIISHATGCMEVVSTPYPQTAWTLPWVHCAFENAAAVASGVHRALKAQGRREGINLIAIGGDGGTFDIGFQALSGAAERREKFTYICYENGSYMNTGVQRSGATPKFAATTTTPAGTKIHGKMELKKPMPFIMAAHGISYSATANIAYPKDFVDKVRKALSSDGVSYVEVFSSCPLGWKCQSRDSIKVAKLAVLTRFAPLFEIVDGKVRTTLDVPEPKPVKEFLALQGRFSHLTAQEIEEIQKYVNKEWDRIKKLEQSGVEL